MVSINLPAKLQKKSFAEKQNTKKVQTIVVFLLFCLLQILGDALMGARQCPFFLLFASTIKAMLTMNKSIALIE